MTKKQNTRPSIRPLVSVIMPAYNSQAYLSAAIDSILLQTYQNFELIIVDDASTDRSWQIIQKYARQNPKKIRAFRMKQNANCGGDACANYALSQVSPQSKYVARMDADDISHPTRLAKQVAYLESHPQTFLVGANAHVINSIGAVVGDKLEPSSHKDIFASYFTYHPLIHPTVLMRRTLKDGTPFSYDIKFSASNDYYTFFKLICQKYRFHNLEEKLLDYRIHGQNATFVNVKQNFLNALKIRLEVLKTYHYPLSIKDALMTLIQAGTMILLPEKLVTKAYLWAKGISKKQKKHHDLAQSTQINAQTDVIGKASSAKSTSGTYQRLKTPSLAAR